MSIDGWCPRCVVRNGEHEQGCTALYAALENDHRGDGQLWMIEDTMAGNGERWDRVEALLDEIESALEVGLEEIYPEEWGAVNAREIVIGIASDITNYIFGAAEDYEAYEREQLTRHGWS